MKLSLRLKWQVLTKHEQRDAHFHMNQLKCWTSFHNKWPSPLVSMNLVHKFLDDRFWRRWHFTTHKSNQFVSKVVEAHFKETKALPNSLARTCLYFYLMTNVLESVIVYCEGVCQHSYKTCLSKWYKSRIQRLMTYIHLKSCVYQQECIGCRMQVASPKIALGCS